MELYPSWQSSRERLGRYRVRRPEESALYRIVYHHREELEYRWDELFFERYGALRQEVLVEDPERVEGKPSTAILTVALCAMEQPAPAARSVITLS